MSHHLEGVSERCPGDEKECFVGYSPGCIGQNRITVGIRRCSFRPAALIRAPLSQLVDALCSVSLHVPSTWLLAVGDGSDPFVNDFRFDPAVRNARVHHLVEEELTGRLEVSHVASFGGAA